MSLALFQKELRSWLHGGADALPGGLGEAAAPGLRVYKNNYRSQLINCLEQSFPLTQAWMGDGHFRLASETHVAKVAPSSWTIDAYAQRFPQTLAKLHEADPEIFELAWLEWALGEAFVGRDETALGPADLAAVDWDSAAIRLSATLWTIPAQTNAGAIWAALSAGEMPPSAETLDGDFRYLVWRSGFVSRFRTIDAREFDALLSIAGGASFAEMCAALVEERGEEEGIAAAGAMLGRWIQDGLIIGIESAGADPLDGSRAHLQGAH